ncbi:MAG: Smr/MutS family protein [Deltaproteobacteria bacterium]|nr:Smr/MutS family protein [Deltaproteobacteria bacterium]
MKGKKSRPAPRGWPPASAKDPIPKEEQELFLEALEDLSAVPDKDQPVATAPAAGRLPAKKPLPRKAVLQPDDSLDLHRMTQAEARLALGRFVRRAAGEGLKQVLVITGKGLSSPGGVSVLKKELERWLRNEGQSLVSSYSEAPRALGGRGAYLLRLR